MFNTAKKYKQKHIIISLGIILCLGIMSAYVYVKIMPKWFSQSETYTLIKEAF